MCSGVCVGTHPRSCVVAPPGGVGSLPGPAARPSLAPAPPLGCEERGGSSSLPRHPPCVFQALRGDFPGVYLHGRCGGSSRRRFIFTVGVCGGDLGPASFALFPPTPPPLWATNSEMHSPRARAGAGPSGSPAPASPGVPGTGEKATERNFPLYDCVTFG